MFKVKESSFGEKSFWTMLPSPERTELCKRIGFTQEIQDVKQFIGWYTYSNSGDLAIILFSSFKSTSIAFVWET